MPTNDVLTETIRARGHENVTAEHASTFEVTSDDFLTPAGDCIVGVEADRVPADFSSEFVEACRRADATITASFDVEGLVETVRGRGDPALTFESERSLVFRTSEYVDERTVAVGMECAAAGLDRELIHRLTVGAPLTVTLAVE